MNDILTLNEIKQLSKMPVWYEDLNKEDDIEDLK